MGSIIINGAAGQTLLRAMYITAFLCEICVTWINPNGVAYCGVTTCDGVHRTAIALCACTFPGNASGNAHAATTNAPGAYGGHFMCVALTTYVASGLYMGVSVALYDTYSRLVAYRYIDHFAKKVHAPIRNYQAYLRYRVLLIAVSWLATYSTERF
jgi:hypothetical protein